MEILTRSYGLHDVRVASGLHNLGGFYFSQPGGRRLGEAAACYEAALKMKLEVLGTGHRWVGGGVRGWGGGSVGWVLSGCDGREWVGEEGACECGCSWGLIDNCCGDVSSHHLVYFHCF